MLASPLLGFLLIVSAALQTGAETPIPPTPTRWVTDTAGFMSPQAAAALDRRLQNYEQQTKQQVLVYIGQTTGAAPIEDWAVRAFESWKVGRQGIDDGLVLFIMAQDRRLRIEVGYGLEDKVTDLSASRIINEIIVPRIRAGDNDGAVTAGIDAVTGLIGGEALPAAPAQGRRAERQPLTLGQMILYALVGLVLLFIFVTNPSLAIYLLASIVSGGHRGGRGGGFGGGFGGGGGFRGGGGRSGGGGASGSW